MADSLTVSMREVLPRRDGRVLIVGSSGTGKTTFADRLMRELEFLHRHGMWSPAILTDPKAEFPRPDYPSKALHSRYTVITRAIELPWEFRYPILFRPSARDAIKPETYEPIFKTVWERRTPITLYNDEVLFLGTRPTEHLAALYTQGRSKGKCIISGSQRPKGIPKVCITEANTIYAFYLSDLDDIRAIRQEMPEYDPRELNVDAYEFWYKQRGKPARKLRYERPDSAR